MDRSLKATRHFRGQSQQLVDGEPAPPVPSPPASAVSPSGFGAETRSARGSLAPSSRPPLRSSGGHLGRDSRSLGAQAGLLLGGEEGAPPDLNGAKWLISILEMLRDKTEGRRTQEETDSLEAILFELRMAYIERTRAGGA